VLCYAVAASVIVAVAVVVVVGAMPRQWLCCAEAVMWQCCVVYSVRLRHVFASAIRLPCQWYLRPALRYA
jgi:hypothetical protein